MIHVEDATVLKSLYQQFVHLSHSAKTESPNLRRWATVMASEIKSELRARGVRISKPK